MDPAFLTAISADTVLAAVLLGLFLYAGRIAHDSAGIRSWGIGHFAYTLGAALIDAGADRVAKGTPSATLDALAGLGAVLANTGLVGLAWSLTRIALQRELTRPQRAWMPLAVVAGLVETAWFMLDRGGNFAAPATGMTFFEVGALAVIAWRLRLLDRLPYRVPARLMQLGCAVLVAMYASDLVRLAFADRFTRYLPDEGWVKADLSLWFLLNFCMLMIVSFRAFESFQKSAHSDPLTGLLNRRGMQAALRQRVPDPPASTVLSVLALDLDHFKAVNDRHGHAIGDAVLRALATTLERTVRAGDLVARLGGEEFAVLLVDTPPEVAADLAERLRQRVAAMHVPRAPFGLRVTTSIGVAHGRVPDIGVAALFEQADAALYAAKRGGRDRVEVAAPGAPLPLNRAAGSDPPVPSPEAPVEESAG